MMRPAGQAAGTPSDASATSPTPTFTRTRRRPAPRHLALTALLALTAALYCWNLSRNGWGNDFYAAAAQSGGLSWKALLFGSLDPANSITVDKPPAALWITGLSVRMFGLSSWSVLVPQAIMGVATTALVYACVRRVLLRSGSAGTATAGALIAGLALALTPAAALIFRFNNPDALLVLLMTAAAYCVIRAAQTASWQWMALCGTAIGFAFLTKMLQGLLILPGFGLAYLMFARTSRLKRARDLVIGTVALIVSAGWYVALVELWPADSRPYIGGSTDNSFIDLVLGYNGVARIVGGSGGGNGGPGGNGAPGSSFGGRTGLERLFSNEMGNEISWLLPAALFVLGVGAVLAVRRRLDRDVALGLAVFGSWLLVTGAVFAYMSGTVHPYYTVALAPAIAALLGVGAAVGWRARESWYGAAFLATVVALAAGWGAARAQAAGFGGTAFGVTLALLGVVAAVGVLAGRRWTGGRAAGVAAALVIAGGTATAAVGVATVNTTHTGSIPTAVVTSTATSTSGGSGGPSGPGGPGGMRPSGPGAPDGGTAVRPSRDAPGAASVDGAVVSLLKSTTTTWAAATGGAQSSAGLQLNSGKAVMAIGGFTNDPSPTLDQFKRLVADGKITFYIAGGGGGGPQRSSEIATWVEQNFTATTVGGTTVYRLTN